MELEALVADHTGDRRAAREVGVGEGLDHLLAELILVVGDVEADAQAIRSSAGVFGVLQRPAAALASRQLHGHANDPVAPLDEKRSSHGGVDATGHPDDHAATPAGAGVTTRFDAH